MYRNFRSQNYYTLSYMDTCITIIMYCQGLFLLFTSKQYCLHIFYFRGTYIPAINICLHAKFQIWWCCGFGSTEEAKGEEDKEHEKTCFAVFPGCYVKIYLFLVNLLIFACFRH